MALVTLKELLEDAKKRNYAVGGFNIFNFETLCAVVEVAEELKTPLVIGIPERLFKFVDVDTLSAAMMKAAVKSTMPIAIHLDHARTYEGIMKAVRWGFTSIMFDGSSIPFAENLRRTREIAKISRALGVSVEGEVGYTGQDNSPDIKDKKSVGARKPVTLEMAKEFVEKTKVDAFSIDISSSLNKVCQQASGIDFSKVAELSGVVNIPLVMHGASKLSKQDYKESIKSGIAKINIATDMSLVAGETLKNVVSDNPSINYINLMAMVKKGVKDSVRKYMLSFECISKVSIKE